MARYIAPLVFGIAGVAVLVALGPFPVPIEGTAFDWGTAAIAVAFRPAAFGGRLPVEGGGFMASAMARDGKAGDWRDFEEIAAWAGQIADSLGVIAP